jgi:hypothetical protein
MSIEFFNLQDRVRRYSVDIEMWRRGMAAWQDEFDRALDGLKHLESALERQEVLLRSNARPTDTRRNPAPDET